MVLPNNIKEKIQFLDEKKIKYAFILKWSKNQKIIISLGLKKCPPFLTWLKIKACAFILIKFLVKNYQVFIFSHVSMVDIFCVINKFVKL